MHSEEQHPTSKHRTFNQTEITTIFSFGYQSCSWKRSGPSFRKNPCSGCNSGINSVAVLEYLENLEEAMYTALFSFKPTTFKVAVLFLLDVRCPKCLHSFFCGCLSPTIVRLRNLFFLYTPVAQMLLTPSWVSRWKYVTQLFITVGGKHSINRRTTFSPYPHSACCLFVAYRYGLRNR